MNATDPAGSQTRGDAAEGRGGLAILAIRGSLGGVLMGLANLVPGISGGTRLLAAGVYPAFIQGIAELTTFRFRPRSLVLLGAVGGSAAVAILLLAGATRTLVIEQRWIMFSLFIGLTLGGVPLVWRLARPATLSTWLGAAGGFGLMVVMALAPGGGGNGEGSLPLLLLAGAAGAGAMILPGVSGGYLLLLLGQYLPILAAIDKLKDAISSLRDGALDTALLTEALGVVIPVGIGVVLGVIGISNLLKWLLDKHRHATLGALLGLLIGAVVGLWPFREAAPPEVGTIVKGQVLTAEAIAELDPKDWPLVPFQPSTGQLAGALGLVLLGLGTTLAIDRIGGDDPGGASS
jgi:putative membrane protein